MGYFVVALGGNVSTFARPGRREESGRSGLAIYSIVVPLRVTDAKGIQMSNDAPLRGLYFPYARCLSPTFVKQSLLLFDELAFVDPVERIVREVYFYQEQKRIHPGRPRWDTAEEDYRYLEEEGIIRQLNPFPLIRQYDGLMAQAMLCDLQDPAFMELASNFASRDYWGSSGRRYH